MTTKRYQIRLEGVHATDLSLAVLRDLAELVIEGASRAVRLAVEGRSTGRGSPPAWLAGASDVRLVGLREGSLALDCTARALGELLPGALAPDLTAFDLFLAGADDASQGRGDSDRLDSGVLQTLLKARGLFARGVSRMQVVGRDLAIELTEPVTEVFQRLANELPEPHVDRCVGTMDSLTMSTRSCLIRLADGASLRGLLASTIDLEAARSLLGNEVVAEGTVFFRPSGRPNRIEIDHLAIASPRDEVWKRSPHAGDTRARVVVPDDDLATVFGQWPGSESDEQIFGALRELS